MLVIKQVFFQLHVHWFAILWSIVNIDPEMLINKTFVLIDSIELFRNYDVVNINFIAVGFVNETFLYVSHTTGAHFEQYYIRQTDRVLKMYTNITQEKFFNLHLFNSYAENERRLKSRHVISQATSNKPCQMHSHTLISLKAKS